MVESVVESLFSGFHTDDYPSVNIDVVFENGATWSASSNSQYQFMVPWQVKTGARPFSTWNASLSKAIAALLPQRAANLKRLEGERFSSDLGKAVMERVKARWMSPALSLLRSRYTIERAEIWVKRGPSPYHANDPSVAERAYMDVRLGGGTLPKWLHVAAFLALQDEAVLGADELLQLAPGYENLILSLPWLNRWFADHQQSAWIVFDRGRSLSEDTAAIFDADMKVIQKEGLRREVLAMREQVVLIAMENNAAFWLVLPDRRMVLWRFSTLTNIPRADSRHGLLKWSWADFPTVERLDAWSPWRQCAGAVVSAAGDLVK